MNLTRKSKSKIKIVATVLIALILMSEIIPLIRVKGNGESPPQYLYLRYPGYLSYNFTAKGACYLYADVEDTDYITVTLDGEDFVLSYGINLFPVEFSEGYEVHNVTFPGSASSCIKSFAIEPLYLAEGNVNTSLDEDTVIMFKAGGLVSLLVQPNFSYNWLYVEVNETIYKKMYNTSDYPEVDSQFYSYFVDNGAYCRFDLNLFPGMHNLTLKGNGSIDYKIVVNSDWDEDQLTDVEEVQKQRFHDLDPVIPNVWGFFQKSEGEVYWNSTEDPISEKKEGFFNFFIPNPGDYNLSIDLSNGEVSDFYIDGNSSLVEGTYTANYPNTTINSISVNIENKGWHYVQYYFKPGFTNISFRLNSIEIKLLTPPELIDSDGDGVKDIEESNDLEGINLEDTDGDGLPDSFDLSPESSLTLNKDNITQLLIPTNPDKNSIITLQIKRPENDYSTDGVPRFWRDEINVSITAVLRLYGNQFKFYEDTPITPLTKDNLTYLWGKKIETYSLVYGDPDIGDALPPPSNPNNETMILQPIPTENCFEYQIKFPKNHAAKSDGILDLRFDIVWLVTSYKANKGTEILHYYNLEEDLIIQTIIHREITDLSYIIATPDDFVENQILWALTQNQELGSPETYNLSQDIIGKDTVDYFTIGDAILNDVEEYYNNTYNQENETQVLYISGLYETRDILSEIWTKYDNEVDNDLNDTTIQHYLSFYSVNNVYDNYKYGEEELAGDNKLIFESYTNNFTSLSGLPVEIQVKDFLNAKVLTIIEVLSEPIPNEDIPYSINSDLSDNLILRNKTYIIRKRFNEPVPTIHFIPESDEYKEFTDDLVNQVESGKLFFENNSYRVSKFTIYNYYMNAINRSLGELHRGLQDFYQPEFSDELYDFLRDFSDFLDVYVDFRRSYFLSLKKFDVKTKLDFLDELKFELLNFYHTISLVKTLFQIDLLKPFKDFGIYVLKGLRIDRFLIWVGGQLTKLSPVFIKIGLYLGNKIDSVLSFLFCKDTILFRKKKAFDFDLPTDYKLIGQGVGHLVMGIGFFIWHICDLITLRDETLTGKYSNDTQGFIKQLILSVTALTLDIIMIVTGVYEILTAIGRFAGKFLESATKFLGYVAYIITIAITIVDWIFFVQDVLGGKLTQSEIVIGLVTLISGTLALVGFGICLFSGWTIVGAIVGAVIAVFGLVNFFLAPILNNVSFDVHESSGFTLADQTKLNLRRHNSLEQGDALAFMLAASIWGVPFVWARSRLRLEGDDWIGSWTDWQGKWDPYFNRYWPFDYYQANFGCTILAPTTDLKFRLEFELDYEQIILLLVFPHVFLWRTPGAREPVKESLGIPVLENSMSDFYNHTTELISNKQLELDYQLALDEYRYKDAYDTATEIISRTEGQAGVIPSELENIIDRMQVYNTSHFKITALNEIEFSELIEEHFSEGFRAETLIPESEWGDISPDEIKYLHMISYSYSNGIIVFPNEWMDEKWVELGDALKYKTLRNNLPLKTNIFLDTGGEIIDLDNETGKADVNLKFLLEGPDNPFVNIKLKTTNNFTVSSQTFRQYLNSSLIFTLEDKDKIPHAGVYLLNVSVFMGGVLIYRKDIKFRIQKYSNLTLEFNTPDGPINPGEILNLVNVTNRGTFEECIELTVEGIPEDFIYKDLYPEIYNNSVQYFSISEGATRQCFVINPPRSYTSTPGEYFFTITLNKFYTNETVSVYIYQGSFVVSEFYELDFQYANPELVILDNETSTYPFTITNAGNIEDEFTITFADIGIASSYLGEKTFTLAPGQSKSLSIMLEPLDIGTEILTITATSDHLSKNLIASIVIKDNDIDSPTFTIEAINSESDGNPGTWRIIAEDKSRLFEIGLNIDGENLLFTQADFGTGFRVEILIPIKSELREHSCEGYAIDADLDRGSVDQLKNIHPIIICSIIDDDLDPPLLSNLVISYTVDTISVSFEALDSSDIHEVIITIDGVFIFPYHEFSGESFAFEIFNYWVDAPGIHVVEIEVWDADMDRADDSLSSLLNGIFKTSSGEDPDIIGISGIYGYFLFMLLGIVSVITMLLNSKRRKTQKKSPT